MTQQPLYLEIDDHTRYDERQKSQPPGSVVVGELDTREPPAKDDPAPLSFI